MVDSRQGLRVRMYTSLAAIWQGFTKNAFPGLDFQVRRIALNTAGLFFGVLLPLLLLSAGLVLLLLQGPTLVLWVGVGLMGFIWTRMALAYAFMKVPVAYAFLAPVATVVVMGILLDSARRYLREGGVSWKGRMYGMPQR